MRLAPYATDEIFVGRSAEVLRLRAHAERAAAGVRQVVLIEGSIGMGKTSLIRAVLNGLDDYVLVPVTLFEEDQWQEGYLGQHLLHDHGYSFPRTSKDFVRIGREAAENLNELTVTVIENFHWVDELSSEGMWRGLREIKDFPGLVIVSTRPSDRKDLARWAQLVRSDAEASHIVLENFSLQEVHEVVQRRIGLPVSGDTAQRLHDETDGLPMLVDDMARWLDRTPLYPGRSIEHAISAHRRELRRPANEFRQYVLGRLEVLSSEAREIVDLLSVAKCPQPAGGIAEALGRTSAELDELTQSEFVVFDDIMFGYRLKYASWQNVIVGLLSPERQAELHRMLSRTGGEIQEFEHRARASRLLGGTDESPELAASGLALSTALADRGEDEQAFEALRQSVLLHPTPLNVGALVSLALRAGYVKRLSDGVFEKAFKSTSRGIQRSGLLALILMARGDLHVAAETLKAARDVHSASRDELVLYAHAVAEWGRHSVMHGVLGSAETLFTQTINAMREHEESKATEPGEARLSLWLTDLRGILEAWKVMSSDLPRPGQKDDRLLGLMEAPRRVHLSNETRSELDTVNRLTEVMGELEKTAPGGLSSAALQALRGSQLRPIGFCQEAFQELETVSRRTDGKARDYVNFGRLHYVVSLFYAGLWDEAEKVAFETAEQGLVEGESPDALVAYTFAALVPAVRGEALGQRILAEVANAEKIGDAPAVQSALHYVEAWVSIVHEDYSRAVESLLKLKDSDFVWMLVGLLPVSMMARALQHSNSFDDLAMLLDVIEDPRLAAREELRRYASSHLKGLTAAEPGERMLCLLEALSSIDDIAPPRSSLAEVERGGFRIHRGLLVVDIGDLFVANTESLDQHRTRVLDLLTWAERFFSSCGADTLASHARVLLRGLKIQASAEDTVPLPRMRPIMNSSFGSLTSREREITAMVAGGLTNREIAEMLVLSIRTVETHVRNILAKLKMRSRRELYRRLAEGTS